MEPIGKAGQLNMTQKGLVAKILKTKKKENCNPTNPPSLQVALVSGPNREIFNQSDTL